MPQTLRQIKSRISSVEKIKKITSAMELISTAKLRSLQNSSVPEKRFHLKLSEILDKLLMIPRRGRHALLEDTPVKKKIALCVITSDTGFCGPYNNKIIEKAEEFIEDHPGVKIDLVAIGKKGYNYFSKAGARVIKTYSDLSGIYLKTTHDGIADYLMELFLSGKADEVYAAYINYDVRLHNTAVIEKFLNIERPKTSKEEHKLEPGIDEMLESILPVYVKNRFNYMMLNALISEHSARVIAMKEATQNADDALDELVLSRNKTRQANITRELIEVISSADALKG